jgi:hypothetical protein
VNFSHGNIMNRRTLALVGFLVMVGSGMASSQVVASRLAGDAGGSQFASGLAPVAVASIDARMAGGVILSGAAKADDGQVALRSASAQGADIVQGDGAVLLAGLGLLLALIVRRMR